MMVFDNLIENYGMQERAADDVLRHASEASSYVVSEDRSSGV